MRVRMNIEVANNWPLALVPLPREKTLQNDFAVPISTQNHQSHAILNRVSEIESNRVWEKGSFIDIYI
jgi:hypothetical protein